MATLSQEINTISEEILNNQNIRITINGESITFEIVISRVGESLYASVPELNISAGSQDDNEGLAKIKAMMRLVGKIVRKIKVHKEYDSLESLSIIPISSSKLKAIENFSKIFSTMKAETKRYQVFKEELKPLDEENSVYNYDLTKIGEVDDPAELQAQKMKEQNIDKKVHVLIVAEKNNWVNFIGEAA